MATCIVDHNDRIAGLAKLFFHELAKKVIFLILKLVFVSNYLDPPVGWGSTYCFTDVRVGVSIGVGVHVTPITKGTPAQIFWGGMFFVPQGIGFQFLL